jgi:carboxynorspermidine decarboxylase
VNIPATPAFVFSPNRAIRQVQLLRSGLGQSECDVLYSVKACSVSALLESIRPLVEGFSVSSEFEARLVEQLDANPGSVHLVTPILPEQCIRGNVFVTHVAANSLRQYKRLASLGDQQFIKRGIRINPHLSLVDDDRYDPCRKDSKLGLSPAGAIDAWSRGELPGLTGIHFHNNCLCESWSLLHKVVVKLVGELEPLLPSLEWINLGGGYVWDEKTDFAPLRAAVDLLKKRFDLTVMIEPGAGIVNSSANLVASVVDLIRGDDRMIAVLDTTVNHLPEVFEYQFEPDIAQHEEGGRHEYVLAGCSCLAGDVFGTYTFRKPLEIGSRITFTNVGAYTLVKAHTFNGISLPSIYILDENDELALIRKFTFDDFAGRCGTDIYKHADI